jgi:hypothetical protein
MGTPSIFSENLPYIRMTLFLCNLPSIISISVYFKNKIAQNSIKEKLKKMFISDNGRRVCNVPPDRNEVAGRVGRDVV